MNIQKPPVTQIGNKLTLQGYIDGLGHDDYWFCHHAGITRDILRAIRDGKPIAQTMAQKIAVYLTTWYGHPVKIEDIADIKVLQTGNTRQVKR